ncbi:serine hydrolase domain-containing protein [Gemmatirosa kalamazoonensis]|uniref:serine hydrolase domain-containing protein n=1 Tax=Gemmatirosa kalamazoonensis TaxID=861299 RepID=UPI00046CCD70|nr:serine hydrolase domain-containing protein [Gemmatirosa kalamazoonensis]
MHAQPLSQDPTQVRRPETAAATAPVVPNGGTRGVRDRGELEAFLDGVMQANLRDKHVAGATVAVVKDGALFFAKGYGWSDVAHRTPVSADRSLFRIGSVSKLFTWTAVMQLVEQGKLDLDADVNRYLDFKIPATYPQPITLRHIMTHTPGFEENGRDLISEDSVHIMPMREWLTTRMPARVRPPGTYSSYSNYATALAGYIVQRVSGLSFDDYVEQRILVPLGMTQTSTRQPLPARLKADVSRGYTWGGGAYRAHPFEIIGGAAPAGAVSSSATDMAKFMLAHLEGGAPGGPRILAESTMARMHARAFTHDPRLNGFALGFYEKSSHGLRIIGHGGDTRWFHSDLALVPSERLGVFVSYNTSTGGELSFGPFMNEFLDHYYPTPAPPVTPASDAAAQARRVVGEYTFNRRAYTTFQKAMGLAGDVTVAPADSGRLLLHSALGDTRLVPVGPLLYRDELGGDLVSFKAPGAGGRATYGFLGFAPMMVLERVPWYASVKLHWVVLGLGVFVFVCTVLAAVARAFRRRFGTPRVEDALPGRWLVVTPALLYVVFIVTLVAVLGSSGGLLEGPLTGLRVALALPVVALLLTLGGAAAAVTHWRRGVGTRAARLRYGATVALALLFAWSLNTWNLLGWRI